MSRSVVPALIKHLLIELVDVLVCRQVQIVSDAFVLFVLEGDLV
jgi:hypothetical protein